MPRSEEAEAFFAVVYAAVQEVPHGQVTSYGHIARLIGQPQRPRQVGICLKHLPSPENAQGIYHSDSVPWQRVLNAKGIISPRNEPAGRIRQAEKLRQEGVEVERSEMGELMVDLGTYGWFPDTLPSEEQTT